MSGVTLLNVVGQTDQLTATASLSDGTKQDVTISAVWQSSNPAAATVSSSGLVTAVASGATTVTATYQGHTVQGTISVSITTYTGNTLTATVNGVPFVPTMVTASTSGVFPAAPAGYLVIGATNGFVGQDLLIALDVPAAVGTYILAPSSTAAEASVELGSNGALWAAGLLSNSGTGTITITSVSATAAIGTFSFTATPITGPATGNEIVTDGTFTVTLEY